MEAHDIASSSKGTELIRPRPDRYGVTSPRLDRDGVTSEGEGIGGFAWPHMTFVLVDGCKASHHGYRSATMTLILIPLILKLPC
jgi:hypothetical protein